MHGRGYVHGSPGSVYKNVIHHQQLATYNICTSVDFFGPYTYTSIMGLCMGHNRGKFQAVWHSIIGREKSMGHH